MSSGNSLLKGMQEVFTKFMAVISSDHAYIHKGIGFTVLTDADAVAAAASVYLGFTTPAAASKYIHFRPVGLASSANLAEYNLYEDLAYTGGSEYIPFNRNRNRDGSVIPTVIAATGVTATPGAAKIVTTKAGGNFGNQPAGDGLEILSSAAGDITQTVTIYGTITGTTGTVTSESIALDGTDGTTPVSTVITTWETILGVEMSAVAVGTITVREASGNATVTTMAPAATSAGVETPTSTDGRLVVPLHDASGASTKVVGIIGTDKNGAATSSVDALNGTTEEAHGTTAFNTITKVCIGDVASGTNVTILVPERIIASLVVGSGGNTSKSGGGGPGGDNELVLLPSTSYVLQLSNIGTVTASDLHVELFWYEEDSGL